MSNQSKSARKLPNSGPTANVPFDPAGLSPAPAQSTKLGLAEAAITLRRRRILILQGEICDLVEQINRLETEAAEKLTTLRASYRRKMADLRDEKARLEAEEALFTQFKE